MTPSRLKFACVVAAAAILAEVLFLAAAPRSRASAIPTAPVLAADFGVVAAPALTAPPDDALGLLGQVAGSAAWAVLPQPIHPDAAAIPASSTPVEAFHLRIERLGLDTSVYEGVDLDTLSSGPGHWPGSALPGGAGNVVIAGHRVTWTRPFYDLDLLQPGDIIDVGGARYEVERSFVVGPEDVWITTATPAPTITLFACHPKHSAAQRIVVTGRLIT